MQIDSFPSVIYKKLPRVSVRLSGANQLSRHSRDIFLKFLRVQFFLYHANGKTSSQFHPKKVIGRQELSKFINQNIHDKGPGSLNTDFSSQKLSRLRCIEINIQVCNYACMCYQFLRHFFVGVILALLILNSSFFIPCRSTKLHLTKCTYFSKMDSIRV